MFPRGMKTAALLLVWSATAHAFVTGFAGDYVEVDEEFGIWAMDITVPGTDELVGGTGLLDRLEMRLELSQGSIYQNPNGGIIPPLFPESTQDTFVTIGSEFDEPANVVLNGGAVALGGEPGLTFDNSQIDISWSPVTPVYSPTKLKIARIALSHDAIGEMTLLGGVEGEPDFVVSWPLGWHGDPAIYESPPVGSIISLDQAIQCSQGVRSDAIILRPLFGGGMVTSVSLEQGVFFSAEDVTGQMISNEPMENEVPIDLAFIGYSGHGLEPGTIVTDELFIETWGGNFHYTLAATIPTPPLPDFDMDGTVGFGDFLILSANFSQPGGFTDGDTNWDGIINFDDFLTLSATFGQSAIPSVATPVPEPSFGCWVALFGIIALRPRHARKI